VVRRLPSDLDETLAINDPLAAADDAAALVVATSWPACDVDASQVADRSGNLILDAGFPAASLGRTSLRYLRVGTLIA
jgi:hypothetical protein